ncbi:hypothetical protein C2845_PM15G15130 [Panicum miliaceum]|uniref:Uncharacterized protein n=1 Tax=Panicum miliaceum TaxID=4540 RepID=A0A3L6Q8Q5_PANMI|nr:hypothetical protein C2845_PM15G15130 [Panicum miliaceum]
MGRDQPVYDSYLHPVYGVIASWASCSCGGAAGGAAFHFARGLRASPSGARLASGARAACANAPRVAATFGAVGAAFSAIGAAVSRARGTRRRGLVVLPLRFRRRLGPARHAAGWRPGRRGALLGVAGPLAFYCIDHAGMVWQSRRADADSVLRKGTWSCIFG